MVEDVYDVAILGAGPAGSAMAIELSRRGRRVLLLEAAEMPRDKLCGEFLSTEVSGICKRLGVLNAMHAHGARTITTALCTAPDGTAINIPLPGTAFGLSRRTFDMLLFAHAAETGAVTIDGTAATQIRGSLDEGFEVATDSDRAYFARAAVGAYGRRSTLDRKLNRASLYEGSAYVGFKAHYAGELPTGQIDVHTFAGGYCGLLVEEEGLVNVCWIVHQDRLKEAGGSPDALVSHMAKWSSPLAMRLAPLERTEAFLAVSQLQFRRKELFANDVCLIGDAAGMIAPLCGDGMSMAMTSALIATPLLDAFLSGHMDAAALRRRYTRAWRKEFDLRMVVGRFLQGLFVRPRLLQPGLHLARRFPAIAHSLVSLTRG